MSKPVIEAEFSVGKYVKNEKGDIEFIPITAQVADQTQPLDIEEEVESGVPRDKSVGLDQTDSDYTEYDQSYERGKDNTDSDVIPRSKGDSGISGQEKTTYDAEKANDATSGKPDSYVQTYRENVEPTPAGTEDNHVAQDDSDLQVESNLEARIAKLEKELNNERILRKREAVARQIVNVLASSNLLEDTSDATIEAEVNDRLKVPVEALKRELDITKVYVAKLAETEMPNVKTSALDLNVIAKNRPQAEHDRNESFTKFSSVNLPAAQEPGLYDIVVNYHKDPNEESHVTAMRDYVSRTSSDRNQIADRLRTAMASTTALGREASALTKLPNNRYM